MAHKNTDFEYGWCHTDHKSGRSIRYDWRATDFLTDEPYAARVAQMLDQMGLPMPEKDQIFRGTYHDLLFLDSHGVVLRIGPQDIEDLMNPGILQPLGWLEDRDHHVQVDIQSDQTAPLTVAIYPGIELFKNYLDDQNRPKSAGDLEDCLFVTGAGLADASTEANKGVIRLQDETGREFAVEMLLDADNICNASVSYVAARRSSVIEQGKKECQNNGDLMLYTLTEAFKDAQDITPWQKAFQLHQPLRNLFWQAFNKVKNPADQPDSKKLQRFWQKCAAVTVKPGQKKIHVWQLKTDANGVSGLVRKERDMPELVLHTPWSKKPEYQPRDRSGQMEITRKAIEYIDQPANTKAAVKQACEKSATAKKQRGRKQDMAKL